MVCLGTLIVIGGLLGLSTTTVFFIGRFPSVIGCGSMVEWSVSYPLSCIFFSSGLIDTIGSSLLFLSNLPGTIKFS